MALCRTIRMCLVAILTFTSVLATQMSTADVAAQGADAMLLSDVSLIVQGENDAVDGEESDHDFYALKILTFDLPYDVTRVYTNAPAAARDFKVWSSSVEISNTSYGPEPSGANAGNFYIDVPSSHHRNETMIQAIDEEAEFNATGSEFSNTNYSDGALRLIEGHDSGSYVSPEIQLGPAQTITSATLTLYANSSSNITSSVSNDGGTTWSVCQNDTLLNFSSPGTSLKVRFDFDGNSSAGYEPWITSFRMNSTYVLNSTIFTVHVSYMWTEDFSDGEASLDFSEASEFRPGGTFVLMLYLIPGYEIGNSTMVLTYDEDGTISGYPDKDLYYNMTATGLSQSFEVVLLAPNEGYGLYYIAAIALVVAVGLAIVYSRRSKSKKPRAKSGESASESDGGVPETSAASIGSDEFRRNELVARKKEILAEIEAVKAELASRAISEVAGQERLDSLKKEFKRVRNELNRLPRKEPSELSELTAESPGLESTLATIARLDDDFAKGRLPESSYKSLRKEYVSKAARTISAGADEGSAADVESKKLMEAIVALDEEHERGEIDEKVYAELRSSYRKQLIELKKTSEVESK